MRQSLRLRSKQQSDNNYKRNHLVLLIFQNIKISHLINIRAPVDQVACTIFRTDINDYKSGTAFSDNGNAPW